MEHQNRYGLMKQHLGDTTLVVEIELHRDHHAKRDWLAVAGSGVESPLKESLPGRLREALVR